MIRVETARLAFCPGALRLFLALCLSSLIALSPVALRAAGTGKIVAVTTTGSHPLTVELATTPAERMHGLMGRKSLPPDHGMLFDFGGEQSVDFWMKDTPLSLDMIFIKADGRVQRIERRTTPFSEDIIPAGAPVRYVLEVVGGDADRIGLVAGDHIQIPGR